MLLLLLRQPCQRLRVRQLRDAAVVCSADVLHQNSAAVQADNTHAVQLPVRPPQAPKRSRQRPREVALRLQAALLGGCGAPGSSFRSAATHLRNAGRKVDAAASWCASSKNTTAGPVPLRLRADAAAAADSGVEKTTTGLPGGCGADSAQ